MGNLNLDIPGEIINDEFGKEIKKIISLDGINMVLEIGTGSGGGSTSEIVEGLLSKKNSDKSFHTIELSKTRIETAKNKYGNIGFINFHCGCSILPDEYPTEMELKEFYQNTKTVLNHYPLSTVLQWRNEELEYISNHNVETQLIIKIKSQNSIGNFDFVLIDGSEFTGIKELKFVYGSTYIALDDINGFKNHSNYHLLKNSGDYVIHSENWNLRNGYAIFRHK